MSNTMRVARSMMHGRDAAELAEDLPFLRRVKEAIESAQFVIEGASPHVRSVEGRRMVLELREMLADVKHDAAVVYVVDRAIEAEQLVGTVNMRVVR